MMIGVILITFLVVSIHADDSCVSYVDYMTPILESGDVFELREAFQFMNTHSTADLNTNSILPIERSVVVDKHNLLLLLSLSQPYFSVMNASDMWPTNNNLNGQGELGINPLNTYHGGIRFIYSCQILQERSCFRNVCKYNPDNAVIKVDGHKEIFTPIDNFIAANGSAISDYITEGDEMYVISGFSKMSVQECFARQLFVQYSDDEGCFNSTKFFSLSERTETYRWGSAGNIGIAEKTSFFVVMS